MDVQAFAYSSISGRKRKRVDRIISCNAFTEALILFLLIVTVDGGYQPPPTVSFNESLNEVILDNSIITMTFSLPEGNLESLQFHGSSNLLDIENGRLSFWYLNHLEGGYPLPERIMGDSFSIKEQNENKVEISFERTCCFPPLPSLLIEVSYILLRGSSGFYSYATFDHVFFAAPVELIGVGATYSLNQDKFTYMAVSDSIQKVMPTMKDIEGGEWLADNSTIFLTNPKDPKLKGQVDDNAQYAMESKDLKVHGWISFNSSIGVWVIVPSTESHSGGPLIQQLTSSVGPVSSVDYLSYQFGGKGFTMKIDNNNWRKTFGPHFIYINSVSEGEDPYALWGKAKVQFHEEVQKWPYSFVESSFYAKSDHRGSLTGRFLINDNNSIPALAPFARVGVALSGETNWQMETKGYQFWTEANPNGSFTITSIMEGNYTLYGWVPGYIGEYQLDRIKIAPRGLHQSIGEVVFSPPRTGPTIWEIGIPDRSAAEFFIPDPNPNYTNQVFLHDEANKFRQYGLWDRYTDRYPNQDIVFFIGVSDYKTDWFFAHVPRRMIDGTYQKTTWQVAFSLASVPEAGENYTLWLALASANNANLQVRINDSDINSEPIFSTGIIGDDLAIVGHQIHGMYRLIEVNMPGSLFQVGHNIIFLTQAMADSPFCGLMYDYIRLEGPVESLKKKIPKGKKHL